MNSSTRFDEFEHQIRRIRAPDLTNSSTSQKVILEFELDCVSALGRISRKSAPDHRVLRNRTPDLNNSSTRFDEIEHQIWRNQAPDLTNPSTRFEPEPPAQQPAPHFKMKAEPPAQAGQGPAPHFKIKAGPPAQASQGPAPRAWEI